MSDVASVPDDIRLSYFAGHRAFGQHGGLDRIRAPEVKILDIPVPRGNDKCAFWDGILDAWSQKRHPQHFTRDEDFRRFCERRELAQKAGTA